jgi:YXWGXW repeat-containing protein
MTAMKHSLLAFVLAVGVPAAAGAQVRVRDHRAPTVVVRPAPMVRVHVAPPVARTEVRVAAPSPRHVWVPGYWAWRGSRHVWVSGRWRLPPGPTRVWVEPRWVSEGGQWVFYDGYWGETAAVAPAAVPAAPLPPASMTPPPPVEENWVVEVAPPAPQVERPPPAPSPNHVWIAGYWGWDGRHHVWIPGRWEAPRAGYVWVPGNWEHHKKHWRWHQGYWRR